MYRRRWKLAVLLACGLSAPTPGLPANRAEDIHQLLVQGHFWYQQSRPELAIKAWRKVLRADPDNREAHFGLEELKHFDPDMIDHAELERARRLARQHKYAEALEAYKAAFRGGKPPSSFHAAEYFETLASIEGRWKEARLGLSKLASHYPSNPAYRLSLARVESYREPSRRQALERFEQLAQMADLPQNRANKLKQSWRNALLWLHAKRSDAPRYQAYLERYPDDAEIGQRYAELTIPIEQTPEGAFALLDKGDLKTAAAGFRAMLKKSPDNADALEGLGLAQLRRRHFSQAARYLERAVRLAPRKKPKLQSAIDDARFWAGYQRAHRLFRQGLADKAERAIDKLLEQRPEQAEALLLRGQIASWQGDYNSAIWFYEQALKQRPRDAAAQAGVIDAFINLGDERKASAFLKKYHLSNRQYARARDRLKAARLRMNAGLKSDLDSSIRLLEQAVQLDPSNPWTRLDLARLYLRQRNPDKANALLRELLDAEPRASDETRHAWALLQIGQQHWREAQQALDAIPPERRTPEQQRLLALAGGQWRYRQALAALDRGERGRATELADAMQPSASRSPLITLLHADLLLRLGHRDRALTEAREAVAKLDASDTGLRIKYADMLRRAEQWPALDALLSELQRQWLDAKQKQTIRQLRLSAALTRSTKLLADNHAAEALAVLTPLSEDFNDDIDFQMALAATHQALGRLPRALALYQTVLTKQPDNLDAIAGAYGAALALHDYRQAESITQNALTRHPDHPQLLLQQARLDLMRGHKADARERLRLAIGKLDPSSPDRAAANALLARASREPLPSIGAGLALRSRGKGDGLDRLRERVQPLSWSMALNDRASLSIDLDYLRLDAGRLPASQAQRYGSLILADDADPNRVTRSVEGLGAGISLSSDQWRADLRVLPDDFPVKQVSAGLTWRHQDYGHSLSASIFHRPVRESLLSYAGAFDPSSGLDWGGVARSGAAIGYSLPTDSAVLYSRLRLDTVRGKRVPDNDEVAARVGLQWPLIDNDHEQASLGVQVSFRDFRRDLSEFTLGHGGYFSPSNYLALSLPVSYRKSAGKFDYAVDASIGLQRYRQNPGPLFPGHAGLQQQLNAAARENGDIDPRPGLAETDSAVYTLGGEIGYSPDKRLFLGVWASLNKTDNFKESAGGVFLRYLWNPASLEKMLPAKKFEPPEVW